MTRITLSQRAQDVILLDQTIITHKDAINKMILEYASYRRSLGWIANIPGACDSFHRSLRDLETQLQTLMLVRDGILECTNYSA